VQPERPCSRLLFGWVDPLTVRLGAVVIEGIMPDFEQTAVPIEDAADLRDEATRPPDAAELDLFAATVWKLVDDIGPLAGQLARTSLDLVIGRAWGDATCNTS